MADILIRGMKMPKDGCRDCIFVNRKWRGDVCPILKREVTGNVERGGFQTDCPLVPLPEGHGRLGDLDALADKLYRAQPLYANSREVDWWIRQIRSAPPIVPAEGGGEDG